MRKLYSTLSVISAAFLFHNSQAQCGAPVNGGTASNMFTHIINGTNPVAANKDLNTIVFVHRNNASSFGGSSGHLRYDISTNGGTTWTNDVGALNPVVTNPARYPNGFIYNPPANTSTANAYVGYLAATINSVNSSWNGMVTGLKQTGGFGTTEFYNQPAASPVGFIPHSTVKGAPGVFWAVDGPPNTYSNSISALYVYKGTWNSSTSDIVWTLNYNVTPPSSVAYDGLSHITDYNIAFDPTGTIGWVSMLAHMNTGPANYAYYPVFYKTINGGATWTGPIQVDLNQFTCMTSNITSGNVVTASTEHDLAVDMYGNPHLLTVICNGYNGYSPYYNLWHHMYDITMSNNMWIAHDISNVKAGPNTWGVSPNFASLFISPQAGRSADGKKIFFSWTDNTAYSLGGVNSTPDLFAIGLDVQQQQWTNIKNFSACNPGTAGKILFPHMAEEVLEPALNTFKLATFYAEFSTSANDPALVSNFKFLDNATFSVSEFTTPVAAAPVSIAQGSTLQICPGSTVNLTLNGSFGSIQWSNGNTTNVNPVTSAGVYSVIASLGCNIGIDSITVSNMAVSAAAANASFCPGGSATLTASGNAVSYLWLPDNTTGTVAIVNPAATAVYTLVSTADSFCTITTTLEVTVYSTPTVSIAGSNTVCTGSALTQTASGAATYSWNTGELTAEASFTPAANTSYTVIGFDNNMCSDTATVSIIIKALPNVTANSNRPTTICKGEGVTLTAGGATSYIWNNSQTTTTIAVSPTVTTTYTVTGTNAQGCSNATVYTQPVNACTGIAALAGNSPAVVIYPNPTTGKFIVSMEYITQTTIIEVYSATGQKLISRPVTATGQEIDLGEQAAGMYFVTIIRDNHEVFNAKIIRQ